jgi:hypothetical protein
MNEFQFDPGQSSALMAGNAAGMMTSSAENMNTFKRERPARGSLALDTHFSNTPQAYDGLSSATSFHSSLDPGSSVGYDLSASYSTPTMGSQMDFIQGNLTNSVVDESSPMGVYQHPSYFSAPLQPACHGTFPTIPTTSQDLGVIPSGTQHIGTKWIKQEDVASPGTSGRDPHVHMIPNGREITMRNAGPSLCHSQTQRSAGRPRPPQAPVPLNPRTSIASQGLNSTIGTETHSSSLRLGPATSRTKVAEDKKAVPSQPIPLLKKRKSQDLDRPSTDELEALDILVCARHS